MSPSRIRLALWCAAAALVAAAVGVGAWGTADVSLNGALRTAGAKATTRSSTVAASVTADPPLSAFAAVWEIDPGRPLIDPHTRSIAGPLTRPVIESGLPNVTLLGTVIEPGHSVALFQHANGKPALRAVGEKWAGAEILQIDSDRVTVRYSGLTLILKVDKAPKSRKG